MRVRFLILGCITAFGILTMMGCNDKPNIRTAYDFSLSSWYLPKSVKSGEEVEIRFYLSREEDYKDASYNVGYIQLDGSGRIYDTDRRILTAREGYALANIPDLDTTNPRKWIYTLYYRPSSDRKSELRFFVVDNYGYERWYEVSFNPDTAEDK
jgi:hypothetical protein